MVLSTTAAGTINQTARGLSSVLTSSASEALPIAFSLTRSSTAFADMSKTTHSWPCLMSLRTILAPIRPRPTIPSCMCASFRRVRDPIALGSLRANLCARLRSDRGVECDGQGFAGSRGVLPHQEPTPECVRVVAQPAPRRQLLSASARTSQDSHSSAWRRQGRGAFGAVVLFLVAAIFVAIFAFGFPTDATATRRLRRCGRTGRRGSFLHSATCGCGRDRRQDRAPRRRFRARL